MNWHISKKSGALQTMQFHLVSTVSVTNCQKTEGIEFIQFFLLNWSFHSLIGDRETYWIFVVCTVQLFQKHGLNDVLRLGEVWVRSEWVSSTAFFKIKIQLTWIFDVLGMVDVWMILFFKIQIRLIWIYDVLRLFEVWVRSEWVNSTAFSRFNWLRLIFQRSLRITRNGLGEGRQEHASCWNYRGNAWGSCCS